MSSLEIRSLALLAVLFLARLPVRGNGALVPTKGADPELRADTLPRSVESPHGSSNDDRALKEMFGKMRAAVEEIAALYGDPLVVQVFTNDRTKAAELRARLAETESLAALRSETETLKAERGKLEDEVARDRRQAALLSDRLARQRAALDVVAKAVDRVNQAVEGTLP